MSLRSQTPSCIVVLQPHIFEKREHIAAIGTIMAHEVLWDSILLAKLTSAALTSALAAQCSPAAGTCNCQEVVNAEVTKYLKVKANQGIQASHEWAVSMAVCKATHKARQTLAAHKSADVQHDTRHYAMHFTVV
jgi:hypothetical protein